jgi:uncharacterized protein (TIGR03382 family)
MACARTLGACLLLASAASAEPGFFPLGFLPGGLPLSIASDVSADGSTVVGTAQLNETGGDTFVPFRWTPGGGMVPIDMPVPWAHAEAVSGDGSTVAVWGPPSVSSFGGGYRWTEAGSVDLGFFRDGPTHPYDVSDDGEKVVGSSSQVWEEAFLWTEAGGMTHLGSPPYTGPQSRAHAISGDGSSVVGLRWTIAAGDQGEAFRWTAAEGMVGLGFLPGGDASQAFGVSEDGSVIVGQAARLADCGITVACDYEAFRWTAADGVVGLGTLPGFDYSVALDTSADGSIVVGSSSDAVEDDAAFIWDADHGIRSLQQLLIDLGIDLTGWRLRTASAISADGTTIVGGGINPDGNHEGFVAVIPEPGSTPMLVAGVTALVALGRRRR